MGKVREFIRRTLPLPVRQSLAQQIRTAKDFWSGKDWARDYRQNSEGLHLHIEVQQPIQPSAMFANKRLNIVQAANRVHQSVIQPGQVWSFWHHACQPTPENGYLPGRNIVNGQLTLQIGGGLCQVASLVYHLALLSSLQIEERHAHSVDIYHEHERFTPLGSDATVVWGNRDLRIKNPHPAEMMLECWVEDNTLIGRILSGAPLLQAQVEFVKEQIDPHHALVRTIKNGVLLTQTLYLQQQGMQLQPQGEAANVNERLLSETSALKV